MLAVVNKGVTLSLSVRRESAATKAWAGWCKIRSHFGSSASSLVATG